MAIEKNIDGGPLLQSFIGAIQDGIKNAIPQGQKVKVQVDLEIDQTDLKKAEDALNRLQGASRPSVVPTPGPGEAPILPRPTASDIPPFVPGMPRPLAPAGDMPPGSRSAAEEAETRWQTLKAKGAMPTFQNVGAFSEMWGKDLGDESKGEMKSWQLAASRNKGHKLGSSMDALDDAADQMGRLQAQVEKLGASSGKGADAAAEIVTLREEIERLARTGRDAAEVIGGDVGRAMGDVVDQKRLAALESLPDAHHAPGSAGMTPHDLYRLAQDPISGGKQLLFSRIMKSVQESGLVQGLGASSLTGEGGAISALGGGAAGLASVGALGVGAAAAGFGAGWKINTSAATDAVQDSEGKIADMRMSRAMGRDFDYRGLTWDPNRMHAKSFEELRRNGILNPRQAFQTAAGMGISFDNFEGGPVAGLRLGQQVQGNALDMGVDAGGLAQFVGQSVRSGEVGRNPQDTTRLLASIHAELSEANRIGIGSQEKLGVLASLRQQQQAHVGYVSEDSLRRTQDFSRMLDSAGVSELRGQNGLGVMNAIVNNQNPEYNAMIVGSFLDKDGLNKKGQAALAKYGEGPEGKARMGYLKSSGARDLDLAEMIAEDPAVKMDAAQAFLTEHKTDLSPFQKRNALGTLGIPAMQALEMIGVVNQGGDITKDARFKSPELTGKAKESVDALKKEGVDAMTIQGAAAIQSDMLNTTRDIRTLLEVIKVNTAAKTLWQDTKDQVSSLDNPFDRVAGTTDRDIHNVLDEADLKEKIKAIKKDIKRQEASPNPRN